LHRPRLSALNYVVVELLSGNALFKRPRSAAEALTRSEGDTLLNKLLCLWRCAARKKPLGRSRHSAAHTCTEKRLWDTPRRITLGSTKPINTAFYSAYFCSALYAKAGKARATG
jgi:hypothetical protein